MISESFSNSATRVATIRQHAVRRADELGDTPESDDISISWGDLKTPPGTALFRAQWTDRSGDRALSGLWVDGQIISGPLDAMDALLRRWQETPGGLPDASVAATACSYLFDADDRHRLVTATRTQQQQGVTTPPDSDSVPSVHDPVYRRQEPDLRLVFYWLDRHERAYRVEIRRDSDGSLHYDADRLPDSETRP